MLLGSHVSIAGSLARPFQDAAEIGCDAIQIFVKPPRRLRGLKDFTPEQVATWEEARAASPVQGVVVHANYLINLAGPDPAVKVAREAFLDEMKRCHALGVGTLIFHPGAHLGAGDAAGLKRIAGGLKWALKAGRDYPGVTLCLENMAGQGTVLGHRFEQLATVMTLVGQPERVGVCIDTCHAFAAGYELRNREAYEATLAELDDAVGLERVKAFHLNDSKTPLGSHVDRHEAIAKGKLGKAPFQLLLQDPRWRDVPGLLETPHETNAGFAKDLRTLRRLEKEAVADKPLPRQRKLAA